MNAKFDVKPLPWIFNPWKMEPTKNNMVVLPLKKTDPRRRGLMLTCTVTCSWMKIDRVSRRTSLKWDFKALKMQSIQNCWHVLCKGKKNRHVNLCLQNYQWENGVNKKEQLDIFGFWKLTGMMQTLALKFWWIKNASQTSHSPLVEICCRKPWKDMSTIGANISNYKI